VSGLDHPRLGRSRLFLAYRDGLQPLRFTLEYQDSRRDGGRFPADNREVNKHEFMQRYAELHWADALGHDGKGRARPLSLRSGRMAFEALDRRLIGRNEWRNTSNSFSGLRLLLGGQDNDWQLDLFRLRPLTRLLEASDRPDHRQRFSGLIGHWRRWSELLTLQPYYLDLRQQPQREAGTGSRVQAFGLRAYGWLGERVNWDVNAVWQHGWQGGLPQRGRAFTAELGQRWPDAAWRPRLSASYGYASGDRDPDDGRSERFERFFGFARPWSADDYVIFENIHAPKLRLELQPNPSLRVDAGYSAYWLASRRDRFNNLLAGAPGNRDPSGGSGRFLGHGPDLRLRQALSEGLDLTVGYSRFHTGDFVRLRQQAASGARAKASDFFYLELTFSLAR